MIAPLVVKLEALKLIHRWLLTLLVLAIAIGNCLFLMERGIFDLSSYVLFAGTAAIAFWLLDANIAAVLVTVSVVFLILCFLSTSSPALPFVLFAASMVLNYYWYYRWQRKGQLQEFQLQKNIDDIELQTRESQLSHEKIKSAYQSNLIKIRRYTALNELAKNLAVANKTNEVVVLLIETISKTFMTPGSVYTLLLFDSSVGKALHSVRYSVDTEMEVRLNRERLNRDEVFNAWVISQAKPLFTSDAAGDFRFQNISNESNVRSLVSAPLMAGAEMLGLIRMESCFPSVFKQDDARLLSNFCDLGTVALEHVALYRQTIELAITDGLTGLYVQRYYKERVRDEVSRALEHKLPLCLLMIDVDNFKSYNDTYGHLVGDRVLKVVAQVLRETVRTVDLVARYGGEEFSVLVLKTPWPGAETVAERIRQKVAEQEIVVSQQTTHVTVSIGVAELSLQYKDVEAYIDSADQALYRAKADGKNCVRLFKPEDNHA